MIIVKSDLKSKDLSSTYVQYEIFNPYNLEKLNIDYCKNVKISINTPINLSDQTISLYNSLNQSGYNLFDSNDSFYTDVCTTYTSENGIDVTISDRQNMLYNNNISLCQDNCTYLMNHCFQHLQP